MSGEQQLELLETALAGHGLCVRGWLFPDEVNAPQLTSGEPAGALCLIGHFGGAIWPVFEAWRACQPYLENPLDDWSKAMIGPAAEAAGGEAVFPSDRPWHPFQQWAVAAEGLKPSPLGMLIHPVYGLWHGYRGAILFGKNTAATFGPIDNEAGEAGAGHPCDTCVDKLCLTACPVSAFSKNGFGVPACRTHLKTEAGRQGCMETGCRARDACPVGRGHRYGAEQVRFHMRAFAP